MANKANIFLMTSMVKHVQYQISTDQRYILWSTSAKVKRLTHGCPLFGPSGIFDFL